MRTSHGSNARRRAVLGVIAFLLGSSQVFSKPKPALPEPATAAEQTTPEPQEADVAPSADKQLPADEPAAQVTSGTLVVELVGDQSAHLMLDGKDAGTLPFSASVPTGLHDVSAHGPRGISATRKVAITANERTEVKLTLVENPAKVRVTASDARAVIRIDGTPHGSGQIQAELLPGKHTIKVEQPGYVANVYSCELEPGEFKAFDHVVLERAAPLPNAKVTRSNRGVYTMVALDGMIGKATNTFAANCPLSGYGGTCSSGPTFGGELDVHVGYSFGTFGAEGFVLGGTNFTLNRVNAPRDITSNESAWYGIARNGRYLMFEPMFGAGAAGRVSTRGQSYKLSTAVGMGLAYRFVELHKKLAARTTSTSNSVVRKDEKSEWTGGEGKVMPLFVWDSEIQLGPTTGTRIFLGIHSQVELGSEPQLSRSASTLGFDASTGSPIPLGTGPIDIRRSPAFYIGPRFGVVTGL